MSLTDAQRASQSALEDIRREFLADLPRRMRAIDDAAAGWERTGSRVELQRVVHTLAGAADIFGVDGVAASSRRLEDLLRGGAQSEAIKAALGELRESIKSP